MYYKPVWRFNLNVNYVFFYDIIIECSRKPSESSRKSPRALGPQDFHKPFQKLGRQSLISQNVLLFVYDIVITMK